MYLASRLLHLLLDRVVAASGLLLFGFVMREVVEICSIWQDRFSLPTNRIESSCRLVDFTSTLLSWHGMMHDRGFNPYKDYGVG